MVTVKQFLYITIIATSTLSIYSAPKVSLQQLHKGPWEFMEDTFVTCPNAAIRSLSTLCLRFGIPAALGTATAVCTHNMIMPHVSSNRSITKTVTGISGIIPAALAYQIITNYYKQAAESKALRRFIRRWPENKFYTPELLHTTFEDLYKLYKQDSDSFADQAPEALRLIKKAIYEHFPKKYNYILKADGKSFFDSKHLLATLDLGGTLTGIANIINAMRR